MNELTVINEQKVLGKDFKVYGTFEEPLFLAKDVAEWIDYAWKDSEHDHRDVSKMIQTVDDEEKLRGKIFLSGQKRDVWMLTENGLYEVLMQSTKPVAKEFKKEVKKILHELRTKKSYITTQTISDAELKLREDECRAKRAELIERLGEKSSVQTYKEICISLAINIAANGNYLPLPKIKEKTYKASELASEFGVSAQMFGTLANKNNIKTSENGEFIWDLCKNGKQIENFVYYESGREKMQKICNEYKLNKTRRE